MFRKILNIAVVSLLLITTTGFTISKHYCGPNLVSISINNEAEKCCDTSEGNCCHEETTHYQLEQDFVASITQINFQNDFSIDLDLVPHFLNLNNLFKTGNKNNTIVFVDLSPPYKEHNSLSFLQTYLL